MANENPKVTKEGVLLISNATLLGMVKRDEKTGRPTLYSTEPMDMETIERMFKHLLRNDDASKIDNGN